MFVWGGYLIAMDKMTISSSPEEPEEHDNDASLAEIDKAAAKVLQGYDWSVVSNTKK